MPKGKPAAKPTRWWGTFDRERPDRPPILDATEADARRSAESQTRYYFAPGRFVVRRVELREV